MVHRAGSSWDWICIYVMTSVDTKKCKIIISGYAARTCQLRCQYCRVFFLAREKPNQPIVQSIRNGDTPNQTRILVIIRPTTKPLLDPFGTVNKACQSIKPKLVHSTIIKSSYYVHASPEPLGVFHSNQAGKSDPHRQVRDTQVGYASTSTSRHRHQSQSEGREVTCRWNRTNTSEISDHSQNARLLYAPTNLSMKTGPCRIWPAYSAWSFSPG